MTLDTSMTALDAMILTGFRGGKKKWNRNYEPAYNRIRRTLEHERSVCDYHQRTALGFKNATEAQNKCWRHLVNMVTAMIGRFGDEG